jgi:hypothetical protein
LDTVFESATRRAEARVTFRRSHGPEFLKMRALVLATLSFLAFTAAADAQAPFRFGGAHSGAWCLFDDPWTYNCGFATLQQCYATASGAGGLCQPNPSGPPVPPPRAHKAPRHPPRY